MNDLFITNTLNTHNLQCFVNLKTTEYLKPIVIWCDDIIEIYNYFRVYNAASNQSIYL